MLTKMPDYIIAECGCPHWDSSNSINNNYNNKHHININNNNNYNNNRSAIQNAELFVNNSKKLQILTKDKNHKLLPLRETLTEYYMRIINTKNNCNNNNSSNNKNRRCESVNSLSNGNIISNDPAQQKLQKNKQNEFLRQKQTHFYINTKQSNQNILDKSKRDNKKSTTTASMDTDLDVF